MAISNTTTRKTLSSMALTDVILPEIALDNIIEEEELTERLSSYATKTQLESAIAQLQADVEEAYVPFELYNILSTTLSRKVEELEEIIDQLTSTPQDDQRPSDDEQTSNESTIPNDIVVQPNDDEDDDNDDEQTPSSDDQNQDNTEQTPPVATRKRKAK